MFANGTRPSAVALSRKHTDKICSSLFLTQLYMHVLYIYPRAYSEMGLVLCSSASVDDVKNQKGTPADGSKRAHARKSACEISLNKTSR